MLSPALPGWEATHGEDVRKATWVHIRQIRVPSLLIGKTPAQFFTFTKCQLHDHLFNVIFLTDSPFKVKQIDLKIELNIFFLKWET